MSSEQPQPQPQPQPGDATTEQVRHRSSRYVTRRGVKPGDRHVRLSLAPDHLVTEDGHYYLRQPARARRGRVARWLLDGQHELEGPYQRETVHHQQHSWWKVMCLTGVDYFSTLGYQPGIAALAAGMLSPIATLVLVLLTLFGALPIYGRVASYSPHGEGSISMLERLLAWWKGKLFVLILLGFVATDFIITITLSAADATAHIVENPFMPHGLDGQRIAITLVLIALLCGIFLKGFREAIGIAVALVAIYLVLNLVVIAVALEHVIANPAVVSDWRANLVADHGNVFVMLGVALFLFPKLALGLSGFETGVAVMPLVKGDPTDTWERPAARIHNTRKLLRSAAFIMSGFLLASSFTTTVLIPHAEFEEGGEANGRALAWLAHEYLGDGFGTVYDISTILILWFAGASAMAGLLNIVPRYLPRYGMAPDWARATRPLVLVFTLIAFAVTMWFRADVDAQGGAYATGVLVLMSSAAVAVSLAVRREGRRRLFAVFGLITVVFLYTTGVNVLERPDGIRIATFFIVAIVVASLVSRVFRATELRVSEVVLDATAEQLLWEASETGRLRLIANHPDERDAREYLLKLREQRHDNNIPAGSAVLFLEVEITDASDFAPVLEVRGELIGEFRVLRARAASVPNAIAAFALYARDRFGVIPHIYFGWTEGNPLKYIARFILFGEGDIAPVTHEILRKAEPDRQRRPAIHLG